MPFGPERLDLSSPTGLKAEGLSTGDQNYLDFSSIIAIVLGTVLTKSLTGLAN
jgi:hypothetical protein